jgi:ubiquinone/menaquinone biosynthesis C-methylase UbiE
MESNPAEDSYLWPRSQAETQRLIMQGALHDLPLRRLFEDAGITTGMRVLDIGSGAGDVALTAAALVGPNGSVVGVDVNPQILETARRRARKAGLGNVSFVAGDIRQDLALDGEFDALVGRLVLFHLADPGAVLGRLLRHLRPGGVVAFQEPELTRYGMYAVPQSPLYDRLNGWVRQTFSRAGLNLSSGLTLHRAYLEAGLPAPQMRAFSVVFTGADTSYLDYYVANIRSLLPRMLEYGIATAEEVDVDTLAERLSADFAAEQKVAIGRLNVDAWARKP